MFAQLVGDMLGVSSNLVEIVHGDTARSPFGLGTYGSRSAAVGGAAIAKAVGKIIDNGRKIAGYLLEASEQGQRPQRPGLGPAFALGHAHIWCDGLTRVWSGGFENREFV